MNAKDNFLRMKCANEKLQAIFESILKFVPLIQVWHIPDGDPYSASLTYAICQANLVKAVREGSITFRFERLTSRKNAECNRKTRCF